MALADRQVLLLQVGRMIGLLPSSLPLMSSTPDLVAIDKLDDHRLEKAEPAADLPVDNFDLVELDHVEDKRILRRIDRYIIPFVSLLYLLSFLDRSNVGNAKIVGLVTDLKLKGLQYNVCAAVFFITYAAAEVPSNVALKLVRPSIWIPSIMLAWGIVMTLMSQVKSYHGLIIARIFLGLTEAGLFPGVNFYLTMWYRRNEQAFRIALFFSAATVAGAFGGLLAAALAKLNGKGGMHGWQWIFLVEGLFTIVVSFASYFLMHDYPHNAKFLTEPERAHVVERLRRDSPGLPTHVDRRFFWQALKDYKSYGLVLAYLGILIPLYAFSLFLPTIISGLGYSSGRAQLLSVPPYVGGCLTTIAVGWYSDKYHLRGPFIIVFSTIAIIGYIVLISTTTSGAGYAGAMIAALGIFPTIPCLISWVGNNVGGDLKKGVVIAMVIGIGNLGGVCSSFIYMAKEAPRYHTGHGVCIGSFVMTIIVSSFLMWDYNRLNKQREALCAREGINASRAKEFRDLGDGSPLFRYAL